MTILTPRIRPEPATSAAAQACVEAYYTELATRFPDGFDPTISATVDYDGLAPPEGQFLIVEFEGEALGCGAVRRLEPGIGEIKRMWIAEELRGKGVGQAMLNALEHWALQLDLPTVRLDTSKHLTAAIAMYRANGYREIPPYNDNPYAHLWFEKTLVGPGDRAREAAQLS